MILEANAPGQENFTQGMKKHKSARIAPTGVMNDFSVRRLFFSVEFIFTSLRMNEKRAPLNGKILILFF